MDCYCGYGQAARPGGWAREGEHNARMLHEIMAEVFGTPDPIRRFVDVFAPARDRYRERQAVRL